MPKFYKIMFMMILISSTMISVSSYSWLGVWVGLEVNLLSLIPLMASSSNLSAESTIKYFISQTMASMILFISIMLMMTFISLNLMWTNLIMSTALLTKLGAAPFHFWFPEVIEGLTWLTTSIMLTWQKLTPMVILMYLNTPLVFLCSIAMACMITSGILGMNQNSTRKILTYSSINNIGWMMMTITQEKIWLIYFLIYSLTTINLVMIFDSAKIETISQFFMKQAYSQPNKYWMLINFMNLASIPPFIMFLSKWLTVTAMIKNNMFMITTALLTTTLMSTYMYMQMMMPALMENKILKLNKSENNYLFKKFMNLIALTMFVQITLLFNWT